MRKLIALWALVFVLGFLVGSGCNMMAGAGAGAYKDLRDGINYGQVALDNINDDEQ